jgi:hypothetical protein
MKRDEEKVGHEIKAKFLRHLSECELMDCTNYHKTLRKNEIKYLRGFQIKVFFMLFA